MRRIPVVLFLSSLVFLAAPLHAQEKTGPAFGIGLNAGLQKPFCDVLHTGFAPAGELMVRFLASDYLSLSLSVGGGVLSDGLSYYTFQTNMLAGDLKANISLAKSGRFRPYVFVGAGLYNFEYKRSKPSDWYPWPEPASLGKRFSSNSLILGGGMEILTSPKFAVNLFTDYRTTPSDLLDGVEAGKSKDGYLNARIGFTYYLGGRSIKTQKTEDELIAMQQGESGSSSSASNPKLAVFEAKLDKLEAGDSDMSMESYVRLKSRVDELNQLVNSKEAELEELRSSLDFKSKRIVDLESTLQKGGSSSITDQSLSQPSQTAVGDFSSSYEEALRKFYARRYQEALTMFNSLKQNFPNHQLAGNCQYWVGECYFGLQEYSTAVEAFQGVFNWTNSLKKDDATLMLGRCYVNLHDNDKARGYFQGIINDYPDSEYIEKAKKWLTRIG